MRFPFLIIKILTSLNYFLYYVLIILNKICKEKYKYLLKLIVFVLHRGLEPDYISVKYLTSVYLKFTLETDLMNVSIFLPRSVVPLCCNHLKGSCISLSCRADPRTPHTELVRNTGGMKTARFDRQHR